MKKSESPATRSESGELNAFIDQGSTFEGKLTFNGVVRIDGRFVGDIISDDVLHVGETGRIEGTVRVGEAVIAGSVEGTLTAPRRVHFQPSARFSGELETTALEVEEGAVINGSIKMATTTANAPARELEAAVAATLGR